MASRARSCAGYLAKNLQVPLTVAEPDSVLRDCRILPTAAPGFVPLSERAGGVVEAPVARRTQWHRLVVVAPHREPGTGAVVRLAGARVLAGMTALFAQPIQILEILAGQISPSPFWG